MAKAGVFDSLCVSRKGIHDNYETLRAQAKKLNEKGKSLTQLSLDGYQEEWDRKDLLMNEQEVLGHTISGSMSEVYGNFFRRDNDLVTKLNEIPDLMPNSKVRIEVIINSLIKEFKIKNGPKAGRKFGKYKIEDVYGNKGELTLWTEDYEQNKLMLTDGSAIKALCKVSEYMGQKDLSLVSLERIFGKK
jgi:DNA polymerase III alpha subunit